MKAITLSNVLLTVLLGSLLFLPQCKCEKDGTEPTKKTCRLTNISTDGPQLDYAYDAQNRVVRYDDWEGGYWVLSYGEGFIIGVRYDDNDAFLEQAYLELNGAGNVASGGEVNGNHLNFSYDDNGYLTGVAETRTNGEVFLDSYLVASGNVVSVFRENDNGTMSQWIFDYYTDLSNPGGYFHYHAFEKTLFDFVFTPLPLGKSNLNLVRRTTVLLDGVVQGAYEFQYEFTPEGYVSRMTVSGSQETAIDFTYACE